MNIGAVAKLTGLSSKSIRLYEDKGIISPPARSDSGYREYSDNHIQELNLVSRAKNAGFSLQECKEFVQLAHNPNRKSSEVKERTMDKLREVEEKLLTDGNQKQWKVGYRLSWRCKSRCPIIDELTK
ncbi:Cu(I)-responsive transcriptional regulator [Vibrio parahaemolyticus K5030]|nr:Cu(I)-responsive transcriptional regulator [Vibrio parahaemolyticus K5030]